MRKTSLEEIATANIVVAMTSKKKKRMKKTPKNHTYVGHTSEFPFGIYL